jgi:Fibronectin type III domain
MKQASSYAPYVAAFVVFAFISFLPPGAGAAEFLVPQPYPTIQAAIDAAAAAGVGNSVVVAPGTYQEALIMKDGVGELRGVETARTFLSGGGSGTIIMASNLSLVSAATISGFTFINASVGIQVSNNSLVLSINNNVFEVGAAGTAINVTVSDLTQVINNVFYQNGTAITRDADIAIINNIFSTNKTAIGGTFSLAPANETNNAFVGNTVSGPTGTNPIIGDPLFVDRANSDFHLRAGSPCIDTGDLSVGLDVIDGTLPDIGAYGGPTADPTPFPVAGLSVLSATATSISLAWLPNNCYLVTDPTNTTLPGVYSISYGYASGNYNGFDAGGQLLQSPIDVFSTDVTVLTPPDIGFTLPDLNPSLAPTIAAPVLNQPVPLNTQLALTWFAVPGAEGYKVHYGPISRVQNTVDVGNTTSYTLSGLTNGQNYHVAVSAYARTRYFIAITDFYGTDFAFANQSAFSPEVSVPVGAPQDGGISNEWIEFPEATTHYPLLPNSHGACFIATAAYGDYSAPEVQVLRAFRDLYLLTNGPGRLFVQWYYRNGPAAAALLNAHPGFKPVVRAALLPAVGAAIFLTETSAAARFLVLLITGSAIALGFSRKRRSRTGGLR